MGGRERVRGRWGGKQTARETGSSVYLCVCIAFTHMCLCACVLLCVFVSMDSFVDIPVCVVPVFMCLCVLVSLCVSVCVAIYSSVHQERPKPAVSSPQRQCPHATPGFSGLCSLRHGSPPCPLPCAHWVTKHLGIYPPTEFPLPLPSVLLFALPAHCSALSSLCPNTAGHSALPGAPQGFLLKIIQYPSSGPNEA